MKTIRFTAQTVRSCFRTWHNAPRMLVLLGMISCFTVIYAVPFAENAKAQEQKLQIVEAFIAMTNWRFSMLLFSSSVLLLFGDLPVIEPFTGNALIKGSRRSWITGQVIYVAVTSLILTVFIAAVSVLACLPGITITDGWSRPVKMLALNGRIAISPERMKLPFPKSVVTQYTPWEAFGYSFSLFFLMACFYGLASMALRIRYKSAGFVILLAVNAISWAVGMFGVSTGEYAVLSTLSVHYHASLAAHENTLANKLLPGLDVSYMILTGLLVLFALISYILVRKYDYISMEADHT